MLKDKYQSYKYEEHSRDIFDMTNIQVRMNVTKEKTARQGQIWGSPTAVFIGAMILASSASRQSCIQKSLVSLHHRLRSIKRGKFRLANFASHFKQKSNFHFLIHSFLLESL